MSDGPGVAGAMLGTRRFRILEVTEDPAEVEGRGAERYRSSRKGRAPSRVWGGK